MAYELWIILLVVGLFLFAIIFGIWRLKRNPKYGESYKVSKHNLRKTVSQIDTDLNSFLTTIDNGYVLTIDENHHLGVFTKIRITLEDRISLFLRARWRKPFPYSLDIRAKEFTFQLYENEFSIPLLSPKLKFYSKTPDEWNKIFQDSILKSRLIQMSSGLKYLLFREEYVEISIIDENIVSNLLSILVLIEKAISGSDKSYDVFEVEQLKCYSCDDEFDPTENLCEKCGSQRPRCIVCFLDLKPSEKENVLPLPCCGVYAHWKHIMVWLKQTPKCPNCSEDLSDWLNLISDS